MTFASTSCANRKSRVLVFLAFPEPVVRTAVSISKVTSIDLSLGICCVLTLLQLAGPFECRCQQHRRGLYDRTEFHVFVGVVSRCALWPKDQSGHVEISL